MTTARALTAALDAGEVTATAVTEAALAEIAARDGGIHAFISVDAPGARQAAADSDARRAAGQKRGPLDGVPVAVKDNIAVAGQPRTIGAAAFNDTISIADAPVVARLRDAGAVILGTLNMHEGALGATTDNHFWGRCDNPTAPGHTPGGSSGGSAAAIAAGFVPVTLGTDTMGSVRIPAAYCGLWGLKPTRGLIPVAGLAHLSWTLDTIGPLANSSEDLATMLAVLAGPDPADPQSFASAPNEDRATRLDAAVLATPDAAALTDCAPEVLAAFDRAIAAATDAGARVVPLALDWDPGRLRRAGLLISEVEAAVELAETLKARPEGFSPAFRAALAYGANAPATRIADAYRALWDMAAQVHRAMDGMDAVLMPTAPQSAFAHGAPVPANQADFTALANVAGLPALALPCPVAEDARPISVQLMGRAFGEAGLLSLGAELHERMQR